MSEDMSPLSTDYQPDSKRGSVSGSEIEDLRQQILADFETHESKDGTVPMDSVDVDLFLANEAAGDFVFQSGDLGLGESEDIAHDSGLSVVSPFYSRC